MARLTSYVENGGSLFVLAGPRTSAAAWNQSGASLSQLSGTKLLNPAESGDWHIDPLNYSSPIARPFANFPDAGLLTTPIFRYWKISPTESAADGLITDRSFAVMRMLAKP